jgi:hypothetical protein
VRLRGIHQRGNDVGDHTVLTWYELLAEIPDTAQARWQLNLDSLRRRQIDRVARIESEPNPFVGDAVTLEPVVQQSAGGFQQAAVSPTDDDPPEGAGLLPAKRRAVRLYHEAAFRVCRQLEAVTSEPVHRNGDLNMLQEGS